jgi:hypothetical protein
MNEVLITARTDNAQTPKPWDFVCRILSTCVRQLNRIAKEHGEPLNYSAETIGHRLKKLGITARRLGKAGKGLAMDLTITTRVLALAAVYLAAGLNQDENKLRCPLSTEIK